MHKYLILSIFIISVCIVKAQPTHDNCVNAISIIASTSCNNISDRNIGVETISANTITLDLSHYANGMYMLQYQNEGGVVSQKIIKQ